MQKRRTQFLLVLFWGNVQPCGLGILIERPFFIRIIFRKTSSLSLQIVYIHTQEEEKNPCESDEGN